MKGNLKKIITAGAMSLMCMLNTTLCAVNASADWKTEDGKKYYVEDNKRVKGFYEIKGKTYYFDKNGYMVKGWLTHKGSKYYFGSDGVMKTGWVTFKDGTKYYFKKDGKMAADCTLTIGGKKYFFDEKGRSALKEGTSNKKSREFVHPDFGSSSKKVLRECGVADTIVNKGEGLVVYTGTALVEGTERIISLGFNSHDELYFYSLFIECSKSEYNDIVKQMKNDDTYKTLKYKYEDGYHKWKITNSRWIYIEYDESTGSLVETICDMDYVY